MFKVGVRVLAVVLASVAVAGQESKGYDEILDTYVREGKVYYRALKSDRAKLDTYVNRLAGASVDSMSKPEQMAF